MLHISARTTSTSLSHIRCLNANQLLRRHFGQGSSASPLEVAPALQKEHGSGWKDAHSTLYSEAVLAQKHKIDEFEDYQTTSQNYDTARRVVSPELVLGTFARAHSGIPLADQHILDLGCGTGNVTSVLREHGIRVTGIDANDGMLGQARAKFKADSAVELLEGFAQSLPFENDSFHGVTINQVVHHFRADSDFQDLKDCFSEVFRVLKPGGSLILNTCTPEQHRDGYWWAALFDQIADAPGNSATQRYMDRYAPAETVQRHLLDSGFHLKPDFSMVPNSMSLMEHGMYKQYKNAFDKSYQDCDSSWGIATQPEREAALTLLQTMIDEGSDEKFFADREEKRLQVGQSTFFIATKSSV